MHQEYTTKGQYHTKWLEHSFEQNCDVHEKLNRGVSEKVAKEFDLTWSGLPNYHSHHTQTEVIHYMLCSIFTCKECKKKFKQNFNITTNAKDTQRCCIWMSDNRGTKKPHPRYPYFTMAQAMALFEIKSSPPWLLHKILCCHICARECKSNTCCLYLKINQAIALLEIESPPSFVCLGSNFIANTYSRQIHWHCLILIALVEINIFKILFSDEA